MTQRQFKIHFDVLCPERGDIDIQIEGGPEVTKRWATRAQAEQAFTRPGFAYDMDSDRPISTNEESVDGEVARQMLDQLIEQAKHICTIEGECEWEDLSPLQLAMGITGAIAAQTGGCV